MNENEDFDEADKADEAEETPKGEMDDIGDLLYVLQRFSLLHDMWDHFFVDAAGIENDEELESMADDISRSLEQFGDKLGDRLEELHLLYHGDDGEEGEGILDEDEDDEL
jgi:hypothetical protein